MRRQAADRPGLAADEVIHNRTLGPNPDGRMTPIGVSTTVPTLRTVAASSPSGRPMEGRRVPPVEPAASFDPQLLLRLEMLQLSRTAHAGRPATAERKTRGMDEGLRGRSSPAPVAVRR